MNEKPASHLSFELLKWILICSTFLTFFGTGIQLYTDYRSGVSSINSTIKQIQDSYVKSISNSLWNLDDEQILIQIKGIKKLKDIQYIKISENRKNSTRVYSELGEKKKTDIIEEEFTLEYHNGDDVINIGSLYVQASLNGLYSRILDRVSVILITQTVKTFLISFCILYIIHILVSKKVLKLVSFAKQLSIKNLDAPIVMDTGARKIDEIDELAKSMNQMRVHLKLSVDKMKRSEKNIIKERDYSNGLINGSPYIIFGLTPDGHVNFLNPVGLNITGVRKKEIIGKDFFKNLGIKGNEKSVKEFLDESKYTEVKDFILPLMSKRGTEIIISWSTLLRRNNDGVLIEIIGFGADITQKYVAEKELKEYQQHLEVLVQKRTEEVEQKNIELNKNLDELKSMQTRLVAQQKLASLGGLTSGIAHELNSPLNFITNLSNTSIDICEELQSKLESSSLDEDSIKEYISKLSSIISSISINGKKSEVIIRSMLDHSRINDSNKTVENINTLIETSIDFSLRLIKEEYENFTTKISLNLSSELSLVPVVKGEIERVFTNIITNSLYSMSLKQSESIEGYIPELKISSLREGNSLVIKVYDNGFGIKKDNFNNIFDPFFTTKNSGEGNGLGLSLSRDIIIGLHQGDIDFSSEEGEFAEFKIKIPKES